MTLSDQASRTTILEALDTTLLVEAAAGTGKTTSMVGRMVELVAEGACDVSTLAAVTFTRKATAELRDRFHAALERGARAEQGERRERLAEALGRVEQCFVGTIHSYCARLLRERPVEAGVDVAFRELDEYEEPRLRDAAWDDYVDRLLAGGDPILDTLHELGLELSDLKRTYEEFAEYPDVEVWPVPDVTVDTELADAARTALREYVKHIETLELPRNPESDKLMPMYQEIARRVRHAPLGRMSELMAILERCLTVTGVVQKWWPGGKSQAIAERDRWTAFLETYAEPLIDQWRRRRYGPAIEVLQNAAARYARLRAERGVLSYQDLLMKAADLLRDRPNVRAYFRRRFTHLLVDEFQDTDPVQAEVMMLLTADDDAETRWRQCTPRSGALFVVGDPKQSIYRFRRADIVTYNEVRSIIEGCGQVVSLTVNFRSTPEIIGWVNGVSPQLFPSVADDYAPADEPMDVARDDDPDAGCTGVLAMDLGDRKWGAAIAHEAQVIARTIRDAIDRGLTVPRRDGPATPATPSDFMVLTWRRAGLVTIAEHLQTLGVPTAVTGGSAVNDIDEVMLLHAVLAAVVETDNPVALVGALRCAVFGIADTTLYRYAAGGGFWTIYASTPVEDAEPVAEACARLREYASWFRRMQPLAAVERIAADTGLLARAAAAPDGRDRGGGLAKAIELLRAVAPDQWTPAGLVEHLGRLTDIPPDEKHDGVPLRPHGDAVQVMNLHQAKGLEAPIVLLADGYGEPQTNDDLFIDRRSGVVTGYLALRGRSPGFNRRGPLIALPDDWEELAAEEQRFRVAEVQRLRYVAATRAGTQLVVSRPDKTRRWGPLADAVPAGVVLPVPPEIEPPAESGPPLDDDAPQRFADAVTQRWATLRVPTFDVRRVKELTVHGVKRGAGGEHGTEWGTVVHVLLEAAMQHPESDLTALARATLREEGLHPDFCGEALELVGRVTGSELWRRARAAERCLTEVPIQYRESIDGRPTIVRGVIDLLFREAGEWVIADYKTDDRPGTDLDELTAHYAPQVRAYAGAWHEMVGEPVSEIGLFFVRTPAWRVADMSQPTYGGG